MAQLLTPAQLIDHLVATAPVSQRAQVLGLAQAANQQMLRQLEAERLKSEEIGWADHWRTRYTRTTDTLAAIKQALATC